MIDNIITLDDAIKRNFVTHDVGVKKKSYARNITKLDGN